MENVKKVFFFLFSLIAIQAYSLECAINLSVFNSNEISALDALTVPNCTEQIYDDGLCDCANTLKIFSAQAKKDQEKEFQIDLERKLLNQAQAQLTSILYDIHFSLNNLNLSEAESEEITGKGERNIQKIVGSKS